MTEKQRRARARAQAAERQRRKRERDKERDASRVTSRSETVTPQGCESVSATSVRSVERAANDAEPIDPVKFRRPQTFETLSDAVPYMTPEEKRDLVERSLRAADLEVERRDTELDRARRERSRAYWRENDLPRRPPPS